MDRIQGFQLIDKYIIH